MLQISNAHNTTVIFNMINNSLFTTEIRELTCRLFVLCVRSHCFFNLQAVIRNVRLDEAQDGIKIARRNINSFRYAESEEELKSLLMKVKEA